VSLETLTDQCVARRSVYRIRELIAVVVTHSPNRRLQWQNVFSRDILLDMLEREPGHDFWRELIPGARWPPTR